MDTMAPLRTGSVDHAAAAAERKADSSSNDNTSSDAGGQRSPAAAAGDGETGLKDPSGAHDASLAEDAGGRGIYCKKTSKARPRSHTEVGAASVLKAHHKIARVRVLCTLQSALTEFALPDW